MTLIVGIPLPDCVVLGADGEEGGLIEKSAVRKIASISRDYSSSCVIGGAGDGHFIDLAIQYIRESLTTASLHSDEPMTLERLRDAIEGVVTEIHDERIDNLPAHEQEGREFSLLCGLWTQESGIAQLVEVGRRYAIVRMHSTAIGLGSYLARYLIETLEISRLTRRHAERMTAYILAKAKIHAKDCGGASQIVVLDVAGSVTNVPDFVIDEDESSATELMNLVRGLFHWTDYIGWKGDVAQMESVINTIADRMKRNVRARVARRSAAEAAETEVDRQFQQAPTDAPSAQPPSPESHEGSDES